MGATWKSTGADLERVDRDLARQDLVAGLGNQRVVLNPDAAEPQHAVDSSPGHLVAVNAASFAIAQQRGDEVHARFNGDNHPGLERKVDAVAGGTQREVDWATRRAGRFFPAEWHRFQAGVPEGERDGDLSAAYYRLLLDPDPIVHARAARDWCDWDDRQMRQPGQGPSRRYEDPDFGLCSARLVTHYWSHGHFMDDGVLAHNAGSLAGIPGILIRGALDFAPPIELFWRLAREWPESELVVIEEEGHLGTGAMEAAVVGATDRFARRT